LNGPRMPAPFGDDLLKILYHHRTGSKDGQAVHIDSLVNAFRMLGHEVRIVAPRRAERAAFGSDAGAAISLLKRVMPAVAYELLELGHSFVCFVRLWHAYRTFGPDVLYERYSLFLLAGAWLKRLYGVPFLLEVNAPLAQERSEFGGLKLKRLARRAERYTWRSAHRVFPVTHVLANELCDAGVHEGQIVVVPNGVQRALTQAAVDGADVRRQLGINGRTVLGFVGFMRSWHGLDSVIDLIADAGADAPWHLLLLGDGPALPDLRRRAAERRITSKVTFAGVVPPDRVPAHLVAFDIALQPRVVPYASPLKLIEYMALERAIVAPDVANIREILTDGETALLFDPERSDAFQICIETLTRDPELRRTLGQRARRHVVERDLTWEGNATRVLEAAGSATDSNRQRRSAAALHGLHKSESNEVTP
jgi:glycosyltransferase involved in cell wall biosynthesis